MSLDPENHPVWFIKVNETVYGPYDLDRMRAFASEGRLGSRSQISTQRDGTFSPAADHADLAACFTRPQSPQTTPAQTGKTRRFVIYARISEASQAAFMETLSGFGVAIEAMQGVWLLRAATDSARLRNAMSQTLSAQDTLFIADASQGQSSWFNVGQDTDKRIRQFWQESE